MISDGRRGIEEAADREIDRNVTGLYPEYKVPGVCLMFPNHHICRQGVLT